MSTKTIINDDFLLRTPTAKRLYESYAEKQPIIDYHCHLDPKMIAGDHRFSSMADLMLGGDHYKWRAMRSFGIDEELVTGGADPREKWRAFAKTVSYAIGNPLYHWTALELKRYFGIDEALSERTADRIYDETLPLFERPEYTARGFISRSNVEVICTTDDPADTLEYHAAIRQDPFGTAVIPAFRPDKCVNIHKETFVPYVGRTGVGSYAELKAWLSGRLGFFAENGCRLSDHGLDFIPRDMGCDPAAVFEKAMNGAALSDAEVNSYMFDMLMFFAREYSARGWCMQLHVGALRNNNGAMYRKLGPDTGYDSIADTRLAEPLVRLFDALEATSSLPRTILYSLNPNDLYVLGTLMGCFQGDGVRSKIQLGSAWWFNDQKDGMEAQLRALGNLGVLGAFVGMLTDSRSFVSYTRHEYFRRILCGLLGEWVEDGEYPRDEELLGEIVRGICYGNAKEYFAF